MKKMNKVFGAVALSAALALGTAVPAFAATANEASVTGADTAFNSKSEGVTTISVNYNPSQLSATVPLSLTIVATGSINQVENILAPSYDAYAITNTSSTEATTPKSVTVQSIRADVLDAAAWEMKDLTQTANKNTAKTKGALDIDLTAVVPADPADPTATDSKSAAVELYTCQGTAKSITGTQWTAAAGEKINIEISGTALIAAGGAPTAPATTNALGDAVKVTYTIA